MRCRARSRTGWRTFIDEKAARPASPGQTGPRHRDVPRQLREPGGDAEVSPALARALAGRVLAFRRCATASATSPHWPPTSSRKHAGAAGQDRVRRSTTKRHQARHLRLPARQRARAGRGHPACGHPHRRRADRLRGHLPRPAAAAVAMGLQPPCRCPGPTVRRVLRLLLRARRRCWSPRCFAFILYECLFVPAVPGNWGTLLVWSVGWPRWSLSFFFAGRACCAVCPMRRGGSAAQRVFNLNWRVPAWLKRHDVTIMMAGFFAVVWAEEATGMRHSPRAHRASCC